jgi:hypothetical protein
MSVYNSPSAGTSTERDPAGDHMNTLLLAVHRATLVLQVSHDTPEI